MSKHPLYSQIEEVLRKRIASGIYREHGVLPGEFALAEEFDVSRRTLRKALGALEAAGFISRRPGIGTVIRDTQVSPRRLQYDIAIINDANPDPAFNYQSILSDGPLNRGIMEALGRRGHWMRYIPWTSENRFYDLEEIVSNRRIDGFVFPSPHSVEDVLRRVVEARIPHIAFEIEIDLPGLNAVLADDVQAARQLVKLLYDRGYRHLAFLAGILKPKWMNTANRRRLNGFLQGCAECGLSIPAERLLFFGEERRFLVQEPGLRRQAQQLLQQRPLPQVVILSCLLAAQIFLQVAGELSIRIPDDLAVVTFNGSTRDQLETDPELARLAMFRHELPLLAEKGVSRLQHWLNNYQYTPRIHKIPFQFQAGYSLKET
ncbi:MAG: GntR family transcriptional regulator [Lentisphaerae bacterium]|jgi:DNA-binding LacI/PurR family transcriptional regulator|nr:GntR family transcriptional regulator [Lentisphaerota bacterium]